MQCYVLYKKGIKAAYLGEISIFKSNFSECFEFINRFKNWVHNYDYIFYMIFFNYLIKYNKFILKSQIKVHGSLKEGTQQDGAPLGPYL